MKPENREGSAIDDTVLPSLKIGRIFVLERDQSAARYFEDVLTDAGFDAWGIAVDIGTAAAAAAVFRPDLVFFATDYIRPSGNPILALKPMEMPGMRLVPIVDVNADLWSLEWNSGHFVGSIRRPYNRKSILAATNCALLTLAAEMH